MKYVTGKDNTQFMRNLLTQQFPGFDAFAKELEAMVKKEGGVTPESVKAAAQRKDSPKSMPMSERKKQYSDIRIAENGNVYGYDKKGVATLILKPVDEILKMGNRSYANREFQQYANDLKELGLYDEYVNKFGR
jgi:hypothetical protein